LCQSFRREETEAVEAEGAGPVAQAVQNKALYDGLCKVEEGVGAIVKFSIKAAHAEEPRLCVCALSGETVLHLYPHPLPAAAVRPYFACVLTLLGSESCLG
jgi:hypothetical protein